MGQWPLRYVIEREVSPGVWETYRKPCRRFEMALNIKRQGPEWDKLRGIPPREYRIKRMRVKP